MQSRSLKPRKNYPKHVELMVAPPDPNTSYAHMLEMIGERKKVLDVGCAGGDFARLLVQHECDVVGVDINPVAAEEARKHCTRVVVADLDEASLPDLLEGREFDAIVFGDVLEHLHEPARTLDEARGLLSERGYVVASIPNISHGAIRLALLSGHFDYQELGILDDSHLRFFTSKTVDELFLTAGFRIETVERVTLPLFSESDLVPVLDPRDFDERAIAEIKADPDSETLQFIVKAFPLTNDQRLRTISKRFLAANTELASTKQQIAHRENELASLQQALAGREEALTLARSEAGATAHELEAARERFRTLEDAYHALEVDSLAKRNAGVERALALQTEHARGIETIASLQAKLEIAERARDDARGREVVREVVDETAVAERAALAARVETLEAEAAQIAAARDEARHRAGEVERTLAGLKAGFDIELEAARSRTVEIQSYAESLQGLTASLQSETEGLRARIETLGQEKADVVALAQVESDRTIAVRRVAEALQVETEGMRAEIAALTKAHLRVESQLQDARARGERAEGELAAERGQVKALRDSISHLQVQGEALRGEIASQRSSREKLEIRVQSESERGVVLQAQRDALRGAIEALDADGARLSLKLGQAQTLLQTQRRRFEQAIAGTEAACDELLDDAIERADSLRLQLEAAENEARERRESDASGIVELQSQLEAVRKAALADKLVMRQYGDEARQRADQLYKEFESAIRQRDDLYLRVVDNERVFGENAQERSRLEGLVSEREAQLRAECARAETVQAALSNLEAESQAALANLEAESQAALANLEAESRAAFANLETQSQAAIADLSRVIAETTQRTDAAIADRDARIVTLNEDVTRAQTGLERLRSHAESERTRADAVQKDLASLTVRHEILQTNLAEMDNALVAQTEQLLASTSDERTRLLTLIDTVQSSHFWRLKNWLARLRRR